MKFVEASLFGDIDEDDWSAVHKSAGRDGARQSILYWSVRSTRRDAGSLRLLRLGVVLILRKADEEQKGREEQKSEADTGRMQSHGDPNKAQVPVQ